MRLGLIEAFGLFAEHLAVLFCIRGACASASLKLVEDYLRLSGVSGIRGACASASLKRWNVGWFTCLTAGYPRRMRLGLIEAQEAGKHGQGLPPVSEAHAPRPH